MIQFVTETRDESTVAEHALDALEDNEWARDAALIQEIVPHGVVDQDQHGPLYGWEIIIREAAGRCSHCLGEKRACRGFHANTPVGLPS